MERFEFGVTVKDVVTGFTGVVTAFCVYETGLDQYLIEPPVDKDGKPVDSRWVAEDRLEQTSADRIIFGKQRDKKPSDK